MNTTLRYSENPRAVAVSRISSGVPEENWGKIAGKNAAKNFPESQNAINSRILGTGQGKAAGNLESTLP